MWFLIRPLLFVLPAEFTHLLAKHLIKWIAPFLSKSGYSSSSRIGLAAGFDKNAEILEFLPQFGFGFAEIGTVTPKPQGGNDRPRLFRDQKAKALFNRMGFNNLGSGIVSENVRRAKVRLPLDFKVGINLGKNKSTPDSEAASDYAKVARSFLDCADYFVINVSSPNTPGLRSLQNPEFLIPIVRAVQLEVQKAQKLIPIYVKLAPELNELELTGIIRALNAGSGTEAEAKVEKIAGFVLTNTLAGVYIYREKEYQGGYSGRPLTELSLSQLKKVRSLTSLPIMSVGGIMNLEDAKNRFAAGATEIQIYTGWIYGGPFFIRDLAKRLKI